MEHRELHAKTFCVDETWCSIGSFNLDLLSFHHMLEVTVVIGDLLLARKMAEQFAEDLTLCSQVTTSDERNMLVKFAHWFVYLMCRIVFL